MAILKEIADRAGVSIRTVTRALQASPFINAETREKVLAIAEEMDYRPHFAAKSLKTRQTHIIGIIRRRMDIEPDTARLQLITRGLSEKGYNTLLALYDSKSDPKAAIDHIRDVCDGIIFFMNESEAFKGQYARLAEKKFPFVLVDPAPALARQYPSVVIEREEGIAEAVASLRKSGNTRAAFLTPKLELTNRIEGFKKGLAALGEVYGPERLILVEARSTAPDESTMLMEDALRTVTADMRIGREFNALFCYSDAVAFGALQALYERGLKVPQDVSVIGFNNITYSAHTHVPLTTVAQPIEAPARAAVEMLLNQINGRTVSSETFSTGFIQRKST